MEEPYRYGTPNKGKERFISGIVSPAAPHYVYGLINETQVRTERAEAMRAQGPQARCNPQTPESHTQHLGVSAFHLKAVLCAPVDITAQQLLPVCLGCTSCKHAARGRMSTWRVRRRCLASPQPWAATR